MIKCIALLIILNLVDHQLRDFSSFLQSSSFSSSYLPGGAFAANKKAQGSRHRRNKQEIKDRTNKEAREKAEKEARRQARGVGR